MEKLPWLEYTGQATPDLIACQRRHRIDSLQCAFEEGIQPKLGPSITDQAGAPFALTLTAGHYFNIGFRYRNTVCATIAFPSAVGCSPSRCISPRLVATPSSKNGILVSLYRAAKS